jgi:hypothetical protein
LTYDEWQEAVAHLFRKSSSAGEISYTGNVAVSGGVKVGNTTAACSVSNAGMLKYTNNCMSYCNGSDWKEMSCSINGACGSAHGTNRTESPSTTIEKCVAGTVSSVINESGKWTWTCAGLDGGDTMHCSANKIVDGVCGSAHGTVVTGNPSNKCSAGTARNTYQWNSPSIYFTWICGGLNGGSSVDCSTKPA